MNANRLSNSTRKASSAVSLLHDARIRTDAIRVALGLAFAAISVPIANAQPNVAWQSPVIISGTTGLDPDPQINLLQVRDITSTLASAPTITNFAVRGPTLTITVTSGPANGAFTLLATADITLPLARWSPVLTNSFDGSGAINLVTNVVDPAKPNQFYILRTQR